MASGIQFVIHLVPVVDALLMDDWPEYFATADQLLKLRVNIYGYLILSMSGGLGIIILSLWHFFKRKKTFSAIFLGLIGYLMLTEIIRLYLLDHYASLTDQDTSSLESHLAKTAIVGIVAGLYLNKGKRPCQTFVN